MSPLPLVHVASGSVALVAGAAVLLRRKGDRLHRMLGRVYGVGMLALNLTALGIYRLFDGFGPFHVAALISLGTVIAGVGAARRRRAGWRHRHYYWMTSSYVGLMAATASEIVTRLPDAPFGASVVAASSLVLVLGAILVARFSPVAAVRCGESSSDR